jgi:uracil-DNA glycosylase
MRSEQSEASGRESLGALLIRVRACRICRDFPSGRTLGHEPRPVLQVSPSATLCLAGQAPGTRVHASGRPYSDPSGDRLRDWLQLDSATFYDAGQVAIIPMGFCFPGHDAHGGDLPPRRECRANWHDALHATLTQLRLILAIGAYSQAYHLGALASGGVTATVGRWREILAATKDRQGPSIVPLPHPSWRNNAWIKRNTWFADELLPVLRAEIRLALGGTNADSSVE